MLLRRTCFRRLRRTCFTPGTCALLAALVAVMPAAADAQTRAAPTESDRASARALMDDGYALRREGEHAKSLACFRDGAAGFTISVMNTYYVFLKFAKLRELHRTSTADRPTPR